MKKSGLTLIELVVCIGIVGLLAAILIPGVIEWKESHFGKPISIHKLEAGTVVRAVGSGTGKYSDYLILQKLLENGVFEEPKFYKVDTGQVKIGQVEIGAMYRVQGHFFVLEGDSEFKEGRVLAPWIMSSITNQSTK